MQTKRTYTAIDLKSFYASVECVDRGLDPMTANLIVADPSRTDKTICLAVSPSLKKYGRGAAASLRSGMSWKRLKFRQGRKFPISPPHPGWPGT